MKGHLELFENRLKAAGAKLPGGDRLDMDEVFDDFAAALGTEALPFYDVQSGSTLADYYQSHFIRFVKNAVKA